MWLAAATSWRMARAVGPTGTVYANDIQPEMLEILSTNVASQGVTNVVTVLGTITDPRLPTNALDLVLMVDVYHEFDHPYEMMQGIVRSLKPGGRVVLVEYRGEEKWVPIKPSHKMTEAQVKAELALHPLDWVETLTLPRQHILIFRRRERDFLNALRGQTGAFRRVMVRRGDSGAVACAVGSARDSRWEGKGPPSAHPGFLNALFPISRRPAEGPVS